MLIRQQVEIISEFSDDISLIVDEIINLREEIDERDKKIASLEDEIEKLNNED